MEVRFVSTIGYVNRPPGQLRTIEFFERVLRLRGCGIGEDVARVVVITSPSLKGFSRSEIIGGMTAQEWAEYEKYPRMPGLARYEPNCRDGR